MSKCCFEHGTDLGDRICSNSQSMVDVVVVESDTYTCAWPHGDQVGQAGSRQAGKLLLTADPPSQLGLMTAQSLGCCFLTHPPWHPKPTDTYPIGPSPSTQAGGAFFRRGANCARVKMGPSSAPTQVDGRMWCVRFTYQRCASVMSPPWSLLCSNSSHRKGSTR